MKNNKGKNNFKDNLLRLKNFCSRVANTYAFKLFKHFISIVGTLILIFLLVIGSLLFYFNSKSKSYAKQGKTYIPPFGLYTIVSGSMEPNIHVYDVVVSTDVDDLSTIKVGDIITFISTWDINYGLTVTHRVVSITKTDQGQYQFTTKGDNNQQPDGTVVTQDNLVGKVVMRIPKLGKMQFFLATKIGWFLVVLIPALLVIIYDALKIFKLTLLKNRLNNVVSAEDSDHIYFGTEHLDNRALTDDELDKTRKMIVLHKENNIVDHRGPIRRPLKRRK